MSVKVKGVSKLGDMLEELKMHAQEVKEAIELKQEWLSDKSDAYRESDKGQEWETYLDHVANAIDEIENIDLDYGIE